jgi:glycosyltransferase involved in cell wall biosynthesis
MTHPLVSIIIPAYNSSEYITEALESAFQQVYSPIEVIVIDDGSTDDTRQRLNSYIESGKISYQFQTNRGLAAARNTGIKLAKGEYLQFLDADDLISPIKIEKQVRCLESSPNRAICGCDFRFFAGSDVSNPYGGDAFKGEFPLNSACRLFEFETVIHRWLFPASLFSVFGGFEESMPATEDWLMLWKLAANGTRFIYLDEPLALYRKHNLNMTGNFERVSVGHLLAIKYVEQYQKQHRSSLYLKRDLNALRESYHYELGLFYMRTNRSPRAWYHLLKALVLAPNRRQVKLLLVATIPALGTRALSRVRSANDRLWRWRAHLRKTFVD